MKRILVTKAVDQIGKEVKLSGWVASIRDHGQLLFIDMRDWSGRVQLVVDPANKEVFEAAKDLNAEYVIEAVGTVRERGEGLKNENLETGGIEVSVETLTLLNRSKTIPFPIDGDGHDIDEAVRFKYRYIDLRRERLKEIMKKKHTLLLEVRNWMSKNGFTEVTTPLLTSTSPEGARDYYVPSRLHQGKFFVLPQAPQQYKQLLMVGGVDRYFQIAPCARDEDPRADRHAGVFYQIDIEMSFPTIDEIFEVCETLIRDTYQSVSQEKVITEDSFIRIPHEEAQDRFGSDKPDLRFGMELQDISEVVKGKTDFKIFNDAEVVKCVVAKGAGEWSRKDIDKMEKFAKQHGAKGLAYTKSVGGVFESGISKFISPVQKELHEKLDLEEGDLLFFGAGKREEVNKILGAVRSELGNRLGLKDPNKLAFVWITEFPFYEMNESTGKLDFAHNPFSMPQGGIEAFEVEDPLSIQTNQYDLAVNGYEILSGSIRNHDPEILVKAFEKVGYGRDEIIKRFGGLFNAFQYGAPPHGGWAIGFDRFFMVLTDEPNIRDIYAFPKNSNGMDLLMNAPNEAPIEDMKMLGIEHIAKGDSVMNRIVAKLKDADVEYQMMEHEPVRTSEEAAKVRGTKLSDGAKALVLKSKEYSDKYFMVVVPADKQLDLDKAAKHLGELVAVAKSDEVEAVTGLKVGSIPPFGRLLGFDLYFDKSMFGKETSVFNCGRKDRSIVLATQDLISVTQPDKKSEELEFIVS